MARMEMKPGRALLLIWPLFPVLQSRRPLFARLPYHEAFDDDADAAILQLVEHWEDAMSAWADLPPQVWRVIAGRVSQLVITICACAQNGLMLPVLFLDPAGSEREQRNALIRLLLLDKSSAWTASATPLIEFPEGPPDPSWRPH